MKKTLIALMALTGVAAADVTTSVFTDLTTTSTVNGITWNSTQDTLTAGAGYTLACHTGENAQTTLSFTLNLTQAAAYNGDDLCELITIYTKKDNGDASTTYGLWLTKNGLSGRWDTDEYNTRGKGNNVAEYSGVVSIDSIISDNSTVYTLNGEKYITLTLVTDKSASNNSGQANNVGATTYDANGERVWYCEALASSSLHNFTSIELNTDYISAAAITPVLLSPEAAGEQATMLVPEPTTATLSLLALAGLAVRRRRK